MASGKNIRVLIAEDSAFMCKVLESIISADPQLEVIGIARNGREVISMAESHRPDVITMDINMPVLDGLQATEVIMSTNPRPIVMVSSESREGADATLKALELGAIDFVAKPSSAINLDMNTVREEICRKLKVASKVRVVRTAARSSFVQEVARTDMPPRVNAATGSGNFGPKPEAFSRTAPAQPRVTSNGHFPLVIVAASTGGPAALMRFIPMFRADFSGAVVLVQHMPGTFTSKFSQQLGDISPLKVKEADQGELIRPRTIYVCPGSHHLRISPTGRITLDGSSAVSGYRPSADLAMETAAVFAGAMGIGVVLTGMGTDGVRGVQAIRAAGGYVIAQDEATSVIFGMPAECIRAGAVDQVLGIDAIYPAIEKRILYVAGAAKVGAL